MCSMYLRSGSSKLGQRSSCSGKSKMDAYIVVFTALLADHQLITPHIGEQLVELCSVEPAVLFTVGGAEGSKQNV